MKTKQRVVACPECAATGDDIWGIVGQSLPTPEGRNRNPMVKHEPELHRSIAVTGGQSTRRRL